MTGRGRQRKAKSPDTKCGKTKTRPEEIKQELLPRCPRKNFKEEMQNGMTKEQKPNEQKRANHTEETPSVQSTRKDKTTKHFTEAPIEGTNAKTCASRTKTTEEEIKTQTPNDTTKDSLKTTKAKTCGGKAKSPEQFSEEMTKMQLKTPKDTTKASIKTTKAKACAGKASTAAGKEALHCFKEETTKLNPETCKDTTKTCVPQDMCKDKAAVDSLLHATLEKLKIKKNEKADAAEAINKIITNIVMHLKQNTQCFKEVEEPLHTGSYYENLKISNPDEFDVMLPVPVNRVNIQPFGDDGAFYSVALKRGSSLQKFQEDSTLSASMMLKEFREEVKKSVKTFTEWEVEKKKKGCPAVTLITKLQSVTISLDVVLCLVVKSSWPSFTKDGLKIEGWLGSKVKQEHKRKPYYLVPKYEGRGTVENDGVPAKNSWRVSFSHIEKAILKNHGSEKTCCEKGGERCCRKDCLKLLKHLLSLLKEKDSSFDKFCSYHAKTTLLHACCSRNKDSDWRASSLSHCFQLLLQDFVASLKVCFLPNFFIPSQNLLSGCSQKRCKNLARCIREEGDNGFPIFSV
ncbi:cyclic GMP-AMP synthase [Micropterus dolomieu]|uniref:cyclic GMP-AMP synthase n=1 Tax=Micropterus dolomieu TaxID=147949 RepID=UPI001E8D8F0D|nr:cyclic GMP-AMP synthase [Micropterus dolomieu]